MPQIGGMNRSIDFVGFVVGFFMKNNDLLTWLKKPFGSTEE